jgi:hypothetical protein
MCTILYISCMTLPGLVPFFDFYPCGLVTCCSLAPGIIHHWIGGLPLRVQGKEQKLSSTDQGSQQLSSWEKCLLLFSVP